MPKRYLFSLFFFLPTGVKSDTLSFLKDSIVSICFHPIRTISAFLSVMAPVSKKLHIIPNVESEEEKHSFVCKMPSNTQATQSIDEVSGTK